MISVDGITVEDDKAADAVRRCIRAIEYIDRQDKKERALDIVRCILTGDQDGMHEPSVEPPREVLHLQGVEAAAMPPAPLDLGVQKNIKGEEVEVTRLAPDDARKRLEAARA